MSIKYLQIIILIPFFKFIPFFCLNLFTSLFLLGIPSIYGLSQIVCWQYNETCRYTFCICSNSLVPTDNIKKAEGVSWIPFKWNADPVSQTSVVAKRINSRKNLWTKPPCITFWTDKLHYWYFSQAGMKCRYRYNIFYNFHRHSGFSTSVITIEFSYPDLICLSCEA